MLYKKEGLPEENEIVICTIKKILPNSVFVDLDEYKNREGLIHISEISPGRIRNIRDFVKEGKKIVCKVLRIDRTKGNIDLSLRRVAQSQKINKNNEYKQEIRSEKILEAVAKQNDLTLEEMYNKVGYKLIEEYGTLNVCFEELSKNQEILKQLKLDKKLEKDIITIVKEKIKRDSQHLLQLKKRTFEIPQSKEVNPFRAFFAQRAPQKRAIPPMPQIPELILPPTVQYLRPVPIPIEVNLKKLTPLVRDPLVRIIECNGPNENVVVIGTMGRKKTGTVLNKEEIDEIIKTFSEATKIPINEGIFKVVFGKLILSAIVSDVIGSKFIIKKMPGPPVFHR